MRVFFRGEWEPGLAHFHLIKLRGPWCLPARLGHLDTQLHNVEPFRVRFDQPQERDSCDMGVGRDRSRSVKSCWRYAVLGRWVWIGRYACV